VPKKTGRLIWLQDLRKLEFRVLGFCILWNIWRSWWRYLFESSQSCNTSTACCESIFTRPAYEGFDQFHVGLLWSEMQAVWSSKDPAQPNMQFKTCQLFGFLFILQATWVFGGMNAHWYFHHHLTSTRYVHAIVKPQLHVMCAFKVWISIQSMEAFVFCSTMQLFKCLA
jgi:hypothetical protein